MAHTRAFTSFLALIILFSTSSAFAQQDGVLEIKIGKSALGIDVEEDKVYVTNPSDGKISIIDTKSNSVIDTIDSQPGVLLVEVVPAKNKLYATVENENKVHVYDLQTKSQVNVIDLGEPDFTLFSKADKPYGQREYLTFETNGVGLEYNPANDMLYVVHSKPGHINVIDVDKEQVVDTIDVGITPINIEIDYKRNIGYVTNWESNEVTVVNFATNEVIKSINTGLVPEQMDIDEENNRLYVTHHGSSHIAVIDLATQTLEKKIQLKAPTHALAVDPSANLLIVTYVPDSPFTGTSLLNRVEFINTDTNAVVGGFEIPANPFIMHMADNHQLYASIINLGVVYAVDLDANSGYQDIVTKSQQTQSPGQPGGGCLIATAAYGSELAPQVQFLREIRDNTVMSTSSGAAFMSGFNQLYYSFSPTVADWERESPVVQQAVKLFITPMLSTLHIMTLAEDGNEAQVFGLGLSVIALNLGMYIAAPTALGFAIKKQLKSKK